MSRLGEPEHLLFVEEGGGVGASCCLGEGCSLEKTQVAAAPGRWRGDGDALLQPHHIPDSELHARSSTKLSTHLGEKKEKRLLMREWMLVCIVGDRLVGFEGRGRGREKVGVLFGWEAGCVWWLFGDLGGWPLNSTSPFIHSFGFG